MRRAALGVGDDCALLSPSSRACSWPSRATCWLKAGTSYRAVDARAVSATKPSQSTSAISRPVAHGPLRSRWRWLCRAVDDAAAGGRSRAACSRWLISIELRVDRWRHHARRRSTICHHGVWRSAAAAKPCCVPARRSGDDHLRQRHVGRRAPRTGGFSRPCAALDGDASRARAPCRAGATPAARCAWDLRCVALPPVPRSMCLTASLGDLRPCIAAAPALALRWWASRRCRAAQVLGDVAVAALQRTSAPCSRAAMTTSCVFTAPPESLRVAVHQAGAVAGGRLIVTLHWPRFSKALACGHPLE